MTAGIEITRTDLDAAGLRRAASQAADAGAARRMLALALVLEGASRMDAAKFCGMDRQTLRDWAHRYNEEGLAGLYDRKPPGRAPRLNPAQKLEIAALVERGPDLAVDGIVRWRRVDLARVIERRFGVAMAERTIGKLLRALGFRKMSARPAHPQGDQQARETFKKNSPTWSRKSCRRAPAASRSKSGSRTKPGSASKAR
jgi:transposase